MKFLSVSICTYIYYYRSWKKKISIMSLKDPFTESGKYLQDNLEITSFCRILNIKKNIYYNTGVHL